MKDKLVSFPEYVLDILEEYKKETGINASAFIRAATIRELVIKGFLKFKTREIFVDELKERYKKEVPPEGVMFCDSDKCELEPIALVEINQDK